MWPWKADGPGLLAEVFPAAQLKQRGLPHQLYAGNDNINLKNRSTILSKLESFIEFGDFRCKLVESADALDSVICALSVTAVTSGKLASPVGRESLTEGWIAVSERPSQVDARS